MDLVDSLTEIVHNFQLKVITFENDLQAKVHESGKLIMELESHFHNNQAQLKKFHENVDLSKTLFASDKAVISVTSEAQITALEKSITGMREKLVFHQNELKQLDLQKLELVKNVQNFFAQRAKQMCNDPVMPAAVLNAAPPETREREQMSWAFTANYGMPINSDNAKKPITWPPQAFFKGRSKQFVADLYIKRIEWHEDPDGTVAAFRITLSDNQISPKIGVNSVSLDKSLNLAGISSIRGLVVVSSPHKIIQIELMDHNKEPFATIGKSAQRRAYPSAEGQVR